MNRAQSRTGEDAPGRLTEEGLLVGEHREASPTMQAYRGGHLGWAVVGAFFGGEATRPQVSYQGFLGRWPQAGALATWDAPARGSSGTVCAT